jgi:hypothetical protein
MHSRFVVNFHGGMQMGKEFADTPPVAGLRLEREVGGVMIDHIVILDAEGGCETVQEIPDRLRDASCAQVPVGHR